MYRHNSFSSILTIFFTIFISVFGTPPSSTAASANTAEMIVINGRVWTQDSHQKEVEALAISNGKILATGASKEILSRYRNTNTQVIDAKGRRVIPGLIDSHLHPTRGGRFYASELRWDGVTSLKQALEMITEQAKRTPDGQWIRVIGGWSPFQFAEKRMPTPEELTKAAPNTPVFVLYLYSMGILNKAGIKALNLTPQTKTPEGARYELDKEGKLTGRIIADPSPMLLYKTIGSLPPLTAKQQTLSSRHFYRDLNRFGLTSVIDAGGGGHSFPHDYGGTKSLADSGDLSIRISYYLFPQQPGKELKEFQHWTKEYELNVNRANQLINGYILRGGGEFLAWSAGDYENFLADRPDITKRPHWRKQLLAVVRHLLQQKWPLRIHATYDQSINHILDVFEEAHALELQEGRKGFHNIRWAIDHAETATPATLERIHKLGGGIAMQARMAYAGEFFKERYGKKATLNAPPFRDVLTRGIPLGLGSDATRVASYNPWLTLYWATTGKSLGGEQLHSTPHLLTREEALYLHTVGSAWFSQEEHIKGRLTKGQLADFAILSEDYFTVDPEQIKKIESVLTVVGGRVVYGADDYKELMPTIPPIEPNWSPVRFYGGYQN